MNSQPGDESSVLLNKMGGAHWCESHLEDFVARLFEKFTPEEITKVAIRKTAEQFIFEKVDSEDFSEVRRRVEEENPLMVGVYIRMMAEHMLQLVIQRG